MPDTREQLPPGTPSPEQEPAPEVGSEQTASIFRERERIDRLGRIRQFVFGSLDGLLVPLGVISGVAGGTGNTKAVIIAGVAEAFAGALSMGAGEFISGRSEAQVQRAEIRKELIEMQQEPEAELREMSLLLEHEGVAPDHAAQIAELLSRYPESYHRTMVEKELGLQTDVSTVQVSEGVTMSISYIVGSFFPLVAYFFLPVYTALPVSVGLTLLALIVVGIIRGRLASISLFTSAAEIVAIGGASAIGGYLLGMLIPRAFGF